MARMRYFGRKEQMKKTILAALAGLLLLPAWGGAGEVFLQAYKDKIIDGQIINGTGEVCSSAYATWRTAYISVQWQAVSAMGTANVRVYLQGSIDEINFVVPGGVSDVQSADTSEAWQIGGAYLPMVRQIKVCVKGNSGNPIDTIATVWLGRQ